MADSNNIHGLIAQFDEAPDVFEAAAHVRDAGFKHWDVYTPYPMHGLDRNMGLKRSKVPFFTFFGGMTGFLTGMLIVWYMNAYDYPLIVGGKPYFSPIFPFPVFYELTILLAAFGTFFGMFITNRLPRHNHPVFDFEPFSRASDDKFFIYLNADDPKFNLEQATNLLKENGGKDITPLKN
ncbi:MAG: DUF3341 domain-containing protein [Verrucomicrobia bacterium CG_4_10_14_3_um_filter_43_23]|nr:MAG: hypothetical protein AUJ82_05330 [Verrucomicrobia bacterium CG1_02_43_26]PIP58748.1 MAG: hypothetical protein COX01_06970 [Verrucomicrobia bacterium CG22_combo_CG10-13_8_21_14_all_43_17]PIX58206.1 MAG: DUF3341 domain-containing protein [Verrucomicrobia bacterium CG_4_10_14_3_um_filter_43_23]PIY61541.1 MAG: DUF3341 domain-containing protein [Verrucomicrobia bacterium CG_4_10_14_0_8_um_filter_43_34]PJA44391.1 MAG: DUF3341 domain-containing protein [Verrucomicrobia bacterium CG_4_9_14_3_um